jgi:hypothetical protein
MSASLAIAACLHDALLDARRTPAAFARVAEILRARMF